MKNLFFFLSALTISFCGWSADYVSGKVVTVIDGKTIEVVSENQETIKVLLQGIDSPELGQAYGEEAKEALTALILAKEVRIEIKGKNRWGTPIGVVIIDGETDPRISLLNQGLAWAAEQNPNPQFQSIMESAKENGRGLWKQNDPTPPWQFRRMQTMLTPKFR